MRVRRTLPQRARTLIGAWCFADHYGPDDVSVTGGMDVPPHPHTGLQTVSWLFSGEIEHRDSLGSHAFVRPGELNLMTGGHGISHSEVSTPRTTVLQMLLGGPPFGEEIIMWWNFICRSHEEIARSRDEWMAGERFGSVEGYDGAPLPAPELPTVPLKPRRNPS